MATNMSALGFVTQQGGEFEVLARKCFAQGRKRRCKQGVYIVWEVGQGIELWAQLNENEELIGLNPHFAGKTLLSAGLLERVARTGFQMDGGFKSLSQPYGSDPIQGAIPFVFDAPDFLLHEELTLPLIHSVQLCAFALQCVLYENEVVFQASTTRHKMNYAADACVPLGFQDKDRQPLSEPLASAMLCGVILETAQLTNPVSKRSFTWMKLKNAIGEVDVVADPEVLPRSPKPREILQCSVWLSGKLA